MKEYSGGMRRRLDIAASIVVTPELLFLDEPTTGLDPRSRNQVWEIVRVLVAEGTTVLLTTQYLDEADQLADRIAIIDHGKVIAEGTSGELKALVGSGALHVRLLDPDQRPAAGAGPAPTVLGEPVQLEPDPAALSVRASDPERVGTRPDRAGPRRMCRSTEFALGQPSLDEVFLGLHRPPGRRGRQLRRMPHDRHRRPTPSPFVEDTLRSALSTRARPPRPTRAASRRSRSAGGRCSRSSTSRCSCST